MLQTQTCVSVHCDQCGDSPHSPYPDLEAHWPTADAALTAAAAAGWHVDELPRLWCRDCQTVLRCEAREHEFTAWRRCRCEQLIPPHRAGPGGLCGVELRYCVRCSVLESRPTPEQSGAVVLTCTDCDTTYQPSVEDVASGRSGCPDPDCGGWTFSSALTVPDTGGAA